MLFVVEESSSRRDGKGLASADGVVSGAGVVVLLSACCNITVRLRRCSFWTCLASRSDDIGAGILHHFGVSCLGGMVCYSLLVTIG